MAVVHLAHPGYRAACGQHPPISHTLVTADVTCLRCPTTLKFALRQKEERLEYQQVVDALASPKEDHPCLTPDPPCPTSTTTTTATRSAR
ncbi:hypothetical protein PBI_BEAGLE_110 [Arthrobacter phage Beagle]|nr:hypothetical protein PBI_BEAGLE_110 [Arthrobacter phage Beagle]